MKKFLAVALIAIFSVLGLSLTTGTAFAGNSVSGSTCNGVNSIWQWHDTNYQWKSGLSYSPQCLTDPSGVRMIWQSDGNLVIYSGAHSGGVALWSSRTTGQNAYFDLQTDGNLVVRNGSSGAAIWNFGAPTVGTAFTYRFDIHTLYTMTESYYTGSYWKVIKQVRYH